MPRRPLVRQLDTVIEDRLRPGCLIGEHQQLRVLRDEFAGEHIFLAELGQQNLRVGVPVPIIEDVNETVWCLEAVGIGDGRTFIEQQAALPRFAIIIGKIGRHVRALRKPLSRWTVFHEEDVPRGEAAQEETRVDVLHRRGLLRLAPGCALVGGETLIRIPSCSRQHPQAAVLQLDQHVLIEIPVGKFCVTARLPSLALIGRGIDPGGFLRPLRDRQQPVAVLEDRGLVECVTFVGDAHRLRPHGCVGVGVVAADIPIAPRPVLADHRLIEEQPHAAERIGPDIADERAALPLAGGIERADNELRLRPRRAIIVARGEDEIGVRLVAGACPAAPDATLRRPVHADDHRTRPHLVAKLQARLRDDNRLIEYRFRGLNPHRNGDEQRERQQDLFVCFHGQTFGR